MGWRPTITDKQNNRVICAKPHGGAIMKIITSSACYRVAGLMSVLALVLSACTKSYPPLEGGPPPALVSPNYIIGAGDTIDIFVWRNDELSASEVVCAVNRNTTSADRNSPFEMSDGRLQLALIVRPQRFDLRLVLFGPRGPRWIGSGRRRPGKVRSPIAAPMRTPVGPETPGSRRRPSSQPGRP